MPEEGEIFAGGAYINERVPDGEGLLDTAYEDFTRFLSVTGSLGTRYPISFRASDTLPSDSYTITVNERECTVFASDVEACRRAVFYLEEEFVKREGAVLPIGSVTRRAKIKDRITRGFFSPTNRAPKWGDELFDDVDYYPDEYLNRLAHNGTNGLWIYTSFAQLIKSPYVPSSVEGCERRMQKLSEVVKKCRRYGVKVYIFAIEPMGLTEDECEPCLDMLGADASSSFPKPRRPFCPRIDKTREHIIYCLENIFKSIPELAGYISITAGERPTTCASVGPYKTAGKFTASRAGLIGPYPLRIGRNL